MLFLADAKLADEVDAAQARGELARPGRPASIIGSAEC